MDHILYISSHLAIFSLPQETIQSFTPMTSGEVGLIDKGLFAIVA